MRMIRFSTSHSQTCFWDAFYVYICYVCSLFWLFVRLYSRCSVTSLGWDMYLCLFYFHFQLFYTITLYLYIFTISINCQSLWMSPLCYEFNVICRIEIIFSIPIFACLVSLYIEYLFISAFERIMPFYHNIDVSVFRNTVNTSQYSQKIVQNFIIVSIIISQEIIIVFCWPQNLILIVLFVL